MGVRARATALGSPNGRTAARQACGDGHARATRPERSSHKVEPAPHLRHSYSVGIGSGLHPVAAPPALENAERPPHLPPPPPPHPRGSEKRRSSLSKQPHPP